MQIGPYFGYHENVFGRKAKRADPEMRIKRPASAKYRKRFQEMWKCAEIGLFLVTYSIVINERISVLKKLLSLFTYWYV